MPFSFNFGIMPFGPDPAFNAADPVGSPLGEEPHAPILNTTPAGGGGMKRRCLCLQRQVLDWLRFFTTVQPLDPYTLNGVLWEFTASPFERQLRVCPSAIEALFPGIAYVELAVLDLVYQSTGMKFLFDLGVVKEESKPRLEQEPVGVVRQFNSAAGNESLTWQTADGSGEPTDHALLFGEHPHYESAGKELIVTFPFALTSQEPFAEGTINGDTFTMLVSGDTYAPGTLKYMGAAKETSVVIPAVGIYTGLTRTRKSFIFHYRSPANASGGVVDWNMRWRARDQTWGYMLDMNGNVYTQYPAKPFGAVNWFI